MQNYIDRAALAAEIRKTAAAFIHEFADIPEDCRGVLAEGVDRSPMQMIAYQLGWVGLLQSWDREEALGNAVVTPAPGYKWNQLGGLYDSFYAACQGCSLAELRARFTSDVEGLILWLDGFTEQELFEPGGRRWAASTPSNWPIWKWVHMNTVAPFQSFRGKIRKWKKAQT